MLHCRDNTTNTRKLNLKIHTLRKKNPVNTSQLGITDKTAILQWCGLGL